MKQPVIVNTTPSYPIYFDRSSLNTLCQQHFSEVVIVTDDNVGPLYADQLGITAVPTHVITLPHGEVNKTRATKETIEDTMLNAGCGRDVGVIALGGGVVTDLAGFVAATYCRGVPVIYLPTSLLAMVDAAIGGKTGLNTPLGKNLIGTFTQPMAVMIDVAFLHTLPDSEYFGAFAEVIKHALIYDQQYFSYLQKNVARLQNKDTDVLQTVIRRSCEIKAEVVAADPNDAGLRAILNFGHTVGHAIERVSEYALSHGQAVAMGMMIEAALSIREAGFSQVEISQVAALLEALHLPTQPDVTLNVDAVINAMHSDKKKAKGQVRCVLLNAIGHADRSLYPVNASMFETVMKQASPC